MYYNKVEICGVNTSKLKVLTDEEKKTLLLKVKEGDEEARQELICGNIRLVLSIIQRFTNRKENMDDLFQVGCIGLVKAVDNFNTDLDVKFSTYAVPMIIECRNSKKEFRHDKKTSNLSSNSSTFGTRRSRGSYFPSPRYLRRNAAHPLVGQVHKRYSRAIYY